jgi:protein-S-isoprenylcysteine O-methyltransferase Ste14
MKEEILRYIVLGISILALPCVVFVVLQLFPLDSYTIAGTAVMLPSYIFLIMARVQLGRSFAVSPQAKELVTRGLYSKIRHPVYFFAQLFLLGVVIAFRSLSWLGLWTILLILQMVRARREEQVLEERFGAAYAEYRKSTWF